MDITFQYPAFLWLLVLIPLAWFLPSRVRDVTHGALRCLLILLVILGLARPITLSEDGMDHAVLIVDQSSSLSAPLAEEVASAVKQWKESTDFDGRISLVKLRGGDTEPQAAVSGEGFDAVDSVGGVQSESPLGAALYAARTAIPKGARGAVVVVSDGNAAVTQEAPEHLAALNALREDELAVHVVPLQLPQGDLRITSLDWFEEARVGRTLRLHIQVEGVTGPGQVLIEERLRSAPGAQASATESLVAEAAFEPMQGQDLVRVVVEVEPRNEGPWHLAARVVAKGTKDSRPGNEQLVRTIPVQAPLRLLWMGQRIAGGGAQLQSLLGQGFEVVTHSEDDSSSGPDFNSFDLVMLDDRPASSVPATRQQELFEAVTQRGLGLVMAGGRAAFGPGGWHDTKISALLPTEAVQKEEKKDPSTALAVIIDTSGSMGGERIVLAKEVTRLAIRRLLPHDKVGIVEFYGAKRWAAPLQSAANAINIQRALNRLDAGGGTVILPAIEEAYYGLKNANTRYKHVLILTDAGVETGAFEPLLRRMAKDGICVSTVLTGPGRHSEFLVELASWGNGRYYNASDRFNLPEVILKQPSTARLPAYRPGEIEVQSAGGLAWWGSVDPANAPPLAGYVETRARPGAEVVMETKADKHPLVASWRYGLGRVTSLTTEPTGAGTEPWKDWPDFGPLMSRILERTANDARMPWKFRMERRGLEVRVTADRRVSGVLPMPKLQRAESEGAKDGESLMSVPEFSRRADGHLRAQWWENPMEDVHVVAKLPGRQPWHLYSDGLRRQSRETQVRQEDVIDLAALARASGGSVMALDDLSSGHVPPMSGVARDVKSVALWPWLFALAVLTYLVELFWRRRPTARGPYTVGRAAGIGLLACLLYGLGSGMGSGLIAQEKVSAEELAPGLKARTTKLLESPEDPRVGTTDLYRKVVIRHGSPAPLAKFLRAQLKALGTEETPEHAQVRRLLSEVLRRRGDLNEALQVIRAGDEELATFRDHVSLAQIQDALGEDDAALSAYAKALEEKPSASDEAKIRLRMALLGKAVVEGYGKDRVERSALAVFASGEERDASLKNRAAVVLALRDEAQEAIKLFQPSGDGSARFRQELRLAEWAMEAGKLPAAQDFAWNARVFAKLKRDRRYALTVLADAYRRAEELPKLIDRFEQASNLDEESRTTWIDLLRETGQIDKALKLFESGSDGGFSTEMRRELLELCREADDESILLKAYERSIKAAPLVTEWREGLSRYYLERGNTEAAHKVWADYPTQAGLKRGDLMMAAQTLMNLGQDELALEFADRAMEDVREKPRARLFAYELHLERGHLDLAEKVLDTLDKEVGPKEAVRLDLADAYARLGRKRRAVEVMDALSNARGQSKSGDLEMKLALMLSEVGEEEQALKRWEKLWRVIQSVPRRRYVEERMMTVAARLGKLAKIAVNLETRLADGLADEREAGLLVRLYSRANDSISASEIVEEYMKSAGKKETEVLEEKARVFVACKDYYNYEETIKRLIEVDPKNAPDYLRQLAISSLERGQRDEAREILARLKGQEGDSVSDEFEAGVLNLAGLREEALAAYRRAIARNPQRIDTTLLLSNVQKELGRHQRSAGMFQYMAETAEKDDLFTVAIDGILNMRDGRGNRGAPNRLVEWARRIVLERIAERPDKLYLYQLLADLSVELNDKKMAVRALTAAIPIAGEQRTAMLRELMDMAKGRTMADERRMFGRRLLGQGELVPPQVYLDLGESFLNAGDVANAVKTYNRAAQLPEFDEMQVSIGESFQKKRYFEEALRTYERLFSVQPTDVSLLSRVANLKEQVGKDLEARALYRRGIELLFARRPLQVTAKKESEASDDPMARYYRNRNLDSFATHAPQLIAGIIATSDPKALGQLFSNQMEQLKADIATAELPEKTEKPKAKLEDYPRIKDRSEFLRRLAMSMGDPERADRVDDLVLESVPGDAKLLGHAVRLRLDQGWTMTARSLIERSKRPEEEKRKLRFTAGAVSAEATPGIVPLQRAAQLMLPLLIAGKESEARLILERLDLRAGDKSHAEAMPLLLATAARLNASDSVLSLLRHWVNIGVSGGGGSIYQIVEQVLTNSKKLLEPDARTSLIRHMVDGIVENPTKVSALIHRLPALQRSVGTTLMSAEQVEKILESRLSGPNAYVYGLPELIVLLPAGERGPTLRRIWDRVPKSQRAYFLMQMLPLSDQPLGAVTLAFFEKEFEKSLKDIANKWQVDDSPELLGTHKDNLPLVKVMVEALRKKSPDSPQHQVAFAMLARKLDEDGSGSKGVAEAMAVLAKLLKINKSSYEVNQAINGIMADYRQEHEEEITKLFESLVAKEPKNIELWRRYSRFLQSLNRTDEELAICKAAAEKNPKSEKPLQWQESWYARQGKLLDAIPLKERILELKKTDAGRRKRLSDAWSRLSNPVKALEVLEAAPKKPVVKKKSTGPKPKKKPVSSASVVTLKRALDAGKNDEAALIFRRLWRAFPRPSSNRFRSSVSLRQRIALWRWPATRTNRTTAVRRAPRRLADYSQLPEPKIPARPKTLKASSETADQGDESRSLAEVLVATEFGRQELQRLVQSLQGTQLDGAAAAEVYRALIMRDVKDEGFDAVVSRLLTRERSGMFGKREYATLFTLLESAPEGTSIDVGATLDRLLTTVNPKDTAQVRRLARLYAVRGREDRAALLYSWCADLTGGGGRGSSLNRIMFAGGRSFPGSRGRQLSLLNEAMMYLSGDARVRTVEAIIRAQDPGPDAWGRSNWLVQSAQNWTILLGPEEGYKKSRAMLMESLDYSKQLQRRAAQQTVPFFARAGDMDLAIKAMEIALCRMEPPSTVERWYKDEFANPGYLNSHTLRAWFPEDAKGWADSGAWYELAEATIRKWHGENRLREQAYFEALICLTLRKAERGDQESALEGIEELRKAAKSDARRLISISGLAARTGNEQLAISIERQLMEEGRLRVGLIPSSLARIARVEGPEAALKIGAELTTWCLNPKLLRQLHAWSQQCALPGQATRYQGLMAESRAALEKLRLRRNPSANRSEVRAGRVVMSSAVIRFP